MTRSTQKTPQLEKALKQLDELGKRAPDLAEPIAFYRAMLPTLHNAQANVEPFSLPAEAAQRKLALGQPLLVGENLPLDVEATRNLFLKLCTIPQSLYAASNRKESGKFGWFFSPGRSNSLTRIEVVQSGADLRLAAEQLRRAVEKNELDLLKVWLAVAARDEQTLKALADRHQLDFELMCLFAQNSLRPSLRVWAQGFGQGVSLEDWRRGYCPLCGSPPLLTEIQGKEGERRLRCGVCGADWHYPRLQCAFCANRDHKTLGHITVEGEEEKYRLQTCEQCRSYLKVIVSFDPTPIDLLPVEDLATLHLDLIAAERDYGRATVIH